MNIFNSDMEDLERFDDALIANCSGGGYQYKSGENSLAQVALPLILGGLEIRMTKDVTLLAVIFSLNVVQELIDGILINIPLPESNDRPAADRECGSSGLILAHRRGV